MVQYLLGIVALSMAVAGSAFTHVAEKQQPAQDCVWYYFTGDPTDNTSVSTRTNYVKNLATPDFEVDCPESYRICAVCLPESGAANPLVADFSTKLPEILSANFVTHIESPTIELRERE